MGAVYDTIGKTYDETRKADPHIAQQLWHLLQLPINSRLLDVGCGSGNYTTTLQEQGARCTGIDISEVMLAQARTKSADIEWILGDAHHLPFEDHVFDGSTCILATHHFKQLDVFFREVFRVLKPGARFVLFTATPEQMKGYWLCHYFPEMMNFSCAEMTSLDCHERSLAQAGFTSVNNIPFFVTSDLNDGFLYAGKYRPHIYLDPAVRSGISSFARPGFEHEVATGLQILQDDIASGKINEVIQGYESSMGEYMFITATKPRSNTGKVSQ